MGRKRAFIVLVDRLKIEVVGSEEAGVRVIVRIFIDGGSLNVHY
jgi:hypothetical protein